MLLGRHIFKACLVVGVASISMTQVASAQEGLLDNFESITIRLGTYARDDASDGSKGNPFLDEDLAVVQPAIVFDYRLADDWLLTTDFAIDRVSSASVERFGSRGNQSGASGDVYIGLDFGLQWQSTPDRIWNYTLGYSGEYDYKSIGLGAGVSQDISGGQTQISLNVSGYFDQLDVIRATGLDDGSDNRSSFSLTAKAYHILNPQAHAEFGLSITTQSGFLSTPYNSVFFREPGAREDEWTDWGLANAVAGDELLPDSRLRNSLFGRLRWSLKEDLAVELGGRIYSDDWGVQGLSLEPRLYLELGDAQVLRLRYRWYDQTAADYFSDLVFSDTAEFMTQDSDLGDWVSHTVGVGFESGDWHAALDYVTRSDDLNHLLFSVAKTWKF